MGGGFQEILPKGLHLPSQDVLRGVDEGGREGEAVTLTMSWWKPSSRMSEPELLPILLFEHCFSDMTGVAAKRKQGVTERRKL